MFHKKEKIFHLEEESIRRERKEKRFLIITLVLIVAFSALAVFFVLKKNDFKIHNFFDPAAKTEQQSTTGVSGTGAPVVPAVSGRTNFLLLGVDDKKQVLEYAVLVQSDLDAKTFRVGALPVNTVAAAGSRSDTLQGQLSYGGPMQVVRAVAQLAGVPVDRYVMVAHSKFETVGRKLGTIVYTVPEAVNVTGGAFDLRLTAGEQSLTPETVLKMMRYDWGGSLQKKLAAQNGLIAAALDQLINKENVAKADKLFSEIVNQVDTDITVADFTNSKNALLALAQGTDRKPSGGVTVSGSSKGGGVTLSGESLAALKEGFAKEESRG